jgi:hypothetical protein
MSSQPSGAIFNFPPSPDTYSTKVDRNVIVSGESHQVPFAPAYEFYLGHVPQTGSIIIAGYIEVTGTPLNNQFQTIYTGLNAGLLTFNGFNAGDGPWGVTYTAYGDIVKSEWFNSLQTSVVNIEDFIGSGLGITGLFVHITGGTITGDIVFNGASLLNASSGNETIGSPSNTFGNAYIENVKTNSTQNAGGTNAISYTSNLGLTSNTGISATAPTVTITATTISTSGDIIPQSNNVDDLGSTGSYFSNIYVNNINAPGFSAQFVAKSGDSMSGGLTVNAPISTDSILNINSTLSILSTGVMNQVSNGTLSIQSTNANVSITSPIGSVDINGALSATSSNATFNSSILNSSSGTIDIGSSGSPFGTVYADNLIVNSLSGNFVNRSGDSMYGDLVMGNAASTGVQPYVYADNISSLSASHDLTIGGRQVDIEAASSVRFLIGPFATNTNFAIDSAGVYTGQDIIPILSGVINLGSTSSYYNHVYANDLNIQSISSLSGVTISSGNVVLGSGVNIQALLSGLSNIGSSGNPIGTIYVDTIISNVGTGVYVQKAGDSMTGNLTMNSGTNILATGTVNIGSSGNPISTLYVDSIITSVGSGTFVLRAGDSMTGALVLPTIEATGNLVISGSQNINTYATNIYDQAGQISLTSTTGIVIIDANSEAQLLANSVLQMTISQTGTQFSNNLFPDVSGTHTVGTIQKPFAAIYAQSFIATNPGSGTGTFVMKIGDTMNGTLNFASGVGITLANSGLSNIGTALYPLGAIYADNLISTNPNNAYVHLSGDTMTGSLLFGSGAGITSLSGLLIQAPAANSSLAINANSGISLTTALAYVGITGLGVIINAGTSGLNYLSSGPFYANAGGGILSIQNADIYLSGGSGELIDLSGSTVKISQGGTNNYVATATQNVFYKNLVPSGSGTISIGVSSTPFSGLFIKNINGYAASTQVYNEIPTGAVDGINTIFTTAYTPISGSQRLYRAGLRQAPGGVDYTMAGSTATFVIVPNSGDNILIDYEKPIY